MVYAVSLIEPELIFKLELQKTSNSSSLDEMEGYYEIIYSK